MNQETIDIQIKLPREEAEAFLNAMTGGDDDVLLAMERALRERTGADHAELWFAESEGDVMGDLGAAVYEAKMARSEP